MKKSVQEIRQGEIIDALEETLQQRGVRLPSAEQISVAADMSRQLINHYTPDLDATALELLTKMAERYKSGLKLGVRTNPRTERLTVFLDFYFDQLADFGVEKPRDDQVYDAMFALAAGNEKLRERLFSQYEALQGIFAHEVGVSYPDLPPETCKQLGFLITSLMYGHWKMVATLGFSEDMNKVSRQAIDRLIKSYLSD